MLSLILSILNLDWLQHARSGRGVYEWTVEYKVFLWLVYSSPIKKQQIEWKCVALFLFHLWPLWHKCANLLWKLSIAILQGIHPVFKRDMMAGSLAQQTWDGTDNSCQLEIKQKMTNVNLFNFENGCDVTAYFVMGRTETLALLSLCRKMSATT